MILKALPTIKFFVKKICDAVEKMYFYRKNGEENGCELVVKTNEKYIFKIFISAGTGKRPSMDLFCKYFVNILSLQHEF